MAPSRQIRPTGRMSLFPQALVALVLAFAVLSQHALARVPHEHAQQAFLAAARRRALASGMSGSSNVQGHVRQQHEDGVAARARLLAERTAIMNLRLWKHERCEWCEGMPDGYHADLFADPPCSGYYRCFNQRLAEVAPCPVGRYYDQASAQCIDDYKRSSCANLPMGGNRLAAEVEEPPAAAAAGGGVEEGAVSRRTVRQLGPSHGRMVYSDGVHWPEVNALLEFKRVNIDMNNNLSNWVVPRPYNESGKPYIPTVVKGAKQPPLEHFVCSWSGITCTPPAWHVTQIALPGIGLWGNQSIGQSLPPQWGSALASLVHLDLSFNTGTDLITGLLGTIPSEFGSLSLLTHLDLYGNKLTGSLPDTLSSLRRLKTLNLCVNSFIGTMPPLIGFSSLEKLWLNNNNFTGSIPVSFGSLVSLLDLNLGGNLNMEGKIPDLLSRLTRLSSLFLNNLGQGGPLPTWLSNLKALAALNLAGNKLTGVLPASLGGLTSLGSLELFNNQISGPIPADLIKELCTYPGLSSLTLQNNQLSGEFPAKAFMDPPCTSFVFGTIEVAGNQLTGSIPEGFYPSLMATAINLMFNQLSGRIPRDVFKGPMTSAIYLAGNNLTGELPPLDCPFSDMAGARMLSDVMLGGNSITGNLSAIITPASLKACMETLGKIDFSNNQFTGTLPRTLWSFTKLNMINLAGNNLSGDLPPPAPLCTRKVIAERKDPYDPKSLQLNISRNAFTGPLPTLLGNCSDTQSMDLSNNQFSGALPSAIGNLGLSISVFKVENNLLSGPIPSVIRQLQGLAILDMSGNDFSGSLPEEISDIPRLASLDLSSNSLTGSIPSSLFKLSLLRNLSLADNQFSDSIPQSLAPPNMVALTYLDLSSNNLSGSIPYGFANITTNPAVFVNFAHNNLSGTFPGGNLTSVPNSSFVGNSDMCGGGGYAACPVPTSNSSLSTGAIVGIAVGAFVGLLLIAFLAWWFLHKRDAWAGGKMLVFEKLDFNLTIDHILEATEHFNEKYKLGRGGFGTVYRATLQDGRTVAIKRLAAGSTQGEREVQAEMQTLGNIRHRNLVILVAAYIGPAPANERLLLYNFLSGGSLDDVLAKDMSKESPFRKWEVRRRIALDTARGMKYLHHDCTPRIIHRDMKPANVLLDDQLVAHVADFGLAREVDMTKSHMSTAVFGTIGYLAPEYTQRGRLTFKSDVFAYGVLLLQLITGKQPTDEEVAERGLARWVGASSTASVTDPRIDDGAEADITNQILGAIKLGLLCTSRVAADRPSMAEVVHLLEHLEDFAKGIASSAPAPANASTDSAV